MIGNMPQTNLIELLHDLTHPIPTIPFAYIRVLLTRQKKSWRGDGEVMMMTMATISPSPEANSASRLALRGRTEGLRQLRGVDRKNDFCSRVSSTKGFIGGQVGHQGVWDPPRRAGGVARGGVAPGTLLAAPWLPCAPP